MCILKISALRMRYINFKSVLIFDLCITKKNNCLNLVFFELTFFFVSHR
jgi:hypothetical protein